MIVAEHMCFLYFSAPTVSHLERSNTGTHRPDDEIDLRHDGDIRTDEQGVELSRTAALRIFDNSMRDQKPIDCEVTPK
jgi:hypothetical protein